MARRVLSSDPNAGTPISGGGVDEGRFQAWYHGMAKKHGLSLNPDDPGQFYDYRAAFQAGAKPDATGHWPSDFKREGHPNLIVGGFHVQTGKRVPGTPRAKDAAELVSLGWDAETAKQLAAMPEAPAKRRVLSSDPHAGKPVTELRQGKPQSWWEGTWESARQAIFGSPEREEAKAAGVGLQPTPAEMIDAGMQGAAILGGPLAVAGAASKASGAVGAAGRWALANPAKAGAVVGALPGVVRGEPIEAVVGAVGGAGTGAGSKVVKTVRRALGGRPVTAPAARVPEVSKLTAEEVRAEAQALAAAGKNDDARALIEAFRARPVSAPSAPTPTATTPKADPGRAAATAHKTIMDFAKGVARENPKVGQKIWILLDDAGKPVKTLTPDQAGAAARKGLKTTWVKNLWSAGL